MPSIVNARENEQVYANFKWEKLGFSLTPTDYIYIMKTCDQKFSSQGSLTRYGNIEISPSAAIFNYGQGLFEGLKAYRRKDGGIQLFRPEENALRMKNGADRLCMSSPSVDDFVDAVKQTVLANNRWVPPAGKGSLYIRPLLMGSGPVLGIGPAPECTFLIFASPIGNWYKCGPVMNLYIEDEVPRAIPGGAGGIKSITNYSPVFEAVGKAKARGFTDVLFLDAATRKNVEEVSSCNVFIVKGEVIATPPITGTILPGITRKSIIEISHHLNYKVEERDVPLEEMVAADEVFCTGTAVGVTAVATITHHNKRVEYKTGEYTISNKLRLMLTEIQTGVVEDKMGWTMLIQ